MKDSKVKVDWLGVFVWLVLMPTGTLLGFLILYKLIVSIFNG
tara:strand:- start:1200 stop:1325 length:126 start_codon:yes stop_codon:yes gene_type:complete